MYKNIDNGYQLDMLATICFAKGSKRFQDWFTHTKLYQKHIKPIVVEKEMTQKAKRNILLSVTALFVIGYIIAPIWHAKAVILVIAIFHYYYLLFRVRTIPIVERKK